MAGRAQTGNAPPPADEDELDFQEDDAPPAVAPTDRELLNALVASTTALNQFVTSQPSTGASSDKFASLSISTPLNRYEERRAVTHFDDTITVEDPAGFPRTDAARRGNSKFHRERGRRLQDVLDKLPHDGYLNDFEDGADDQYKTHPITSKDLVSDSDIHKAEVKANSALQSVRWNKNFSFDYNVFHVFKSIICSPHFDAMAKSPDYDSFLSGNPLRFYVAEHNRIAIWANSASVIHVEMPPGGMLANALKYQIPYRPPSGDGKSSDPSFTFVWKQTTAHCDKRTYERYHHADLAKFHDVLDDGNIGDPDVGGSIAHSIFKRYPKEFAVDILSHRNQKFEVLPKYRNNGFRRIFLDNGPTIKFDPDPDDTPEEIQAELAKSPPKNGGQFHFEPVNPLFHRESCISAQEFRMLARALFGYLFRFVEQSTVGQRELAVFDYFTQLEKVIDAVDNPFHHALVILQHFMPESLHSVTQSLRNQLLPMFTSFDPSIDRPEHLAEGLLELQSKLNRYGTAKDKVETEYLLSQLLLRIDTVYQSLPADQLTPYFRAWERFVQEGSMLDDSIQSARVDPQVKMARNDINQFIRYALDLSAIHKPPGLHTTRDLKFTAYVENEPVGGQQAISYQTQLLHSTAPDMSLSSDSEELMVARFANSGLARSGAKNSAKMHPAALKRNTELLRQREKTPSQPMSYYASRGRTSTSDHFHRGRLRDAVRNNVNRRLSSSPSPSARGRSPAPSARSHSAGPRPTGSPRRDVEHPHMRPTRPPDGARFNPALKPKQKEWIPHHAFAGMRDVREQLQTALDSPQDLQKCMSIVRACKSRLDTVLQSTELFSSVDDSGPAASVFDDTSSPSMLERDEASGIPESKYDDDTSEYVDEPEHHTETLDIMSASPHLDADDAALVKHKSDQVLLHLEEYGGHSADERSILVNKIIDDINLDNFHTELYDVTTRAGVDDLPSTATIREKHSSFLECLTMDIHKAIYASNYDSCGSACFETELEGCIEGSFTPFTVERTVKTATGLGSADGMALKRVHVPVTPEIVAKAKKFGIDLSQVDVLTVLVPPIIATKFDGNYSILGGPVMKSLGVGYDQSGWCHNPDFLIWHKAVDVRTELGHKRRGGP